MISKLVAAIASALMGVSSPAMVGEQLQMLYDVPLESLGQVQGATHEPIPERVRDTAGPAVNAEAYVVLDIASGSILAGRNADATQPVASLTKLLTALTVLQHARIADTVTISANASAQKARGADMELMQGQVFRVQDLLAGALVASANDAAVALAEHTAGSEKEFALRMNELASEIGLHNTHVVNATGFDANDHYSSPYDVALLLTRAWNDPVLGVYLRASSLTVHEQHTGKAHRLRTTNRLLGSRVDILAGKTGFTNEAGQSVAIIAENEDGHPVVAVLLGSDDRFADMDNILNWTFWAYEWE